MKGRVAAWIMAALLLVYLLLVFQRAMILVTSGDPIGITMGVALFVLPLVGAWALYRELAFGFRTERMVRVLASRGELPVDDLPKRPSGRPVREAADADFERYRTEVEDNPGSWESWFRLGLAYDASGDRRRARQALRRSIVLYREDPAER